MGRYGIQLKTPSSERCLVFLSFYGILTTHEMTGDLNYDPYSNKINA